MDMSMLKDRVAIVGVGNTSYGNFPEIDDYGLGARAFRSALEDCGLPKAKIDGLGVCRIPYYLRMGEILGVDPTWTMQFPGHGRMAGMAIVEAAMALVTGAATYVALIYGNVGRSRGASYGGGDDGGGPWDPWGFTSPGAAHALMFHQHMQRYGTTTRQLAEVSVAFRRHAILNPGAVMKKPMSIQDHEDARFICEPLRLLDYCLINDGAVSIIMTTIDRARDLRKRPVRITGIGAADAYRGATIDTYSHDMLYEQLKAAGEQCYAMAGIGPEDVDAFMCYDNFSPTVLFALDGLGYCKRGESGSFVEGGTLQLGGRLPTNTDGGHLSCSYMQGWALHAEAVRQLRGECGERQVDNCDVVHYASATPCTRSIIYTAA
jgi:acetyl-CoA acetyltransferase